jgi:hypothetical protein
MANLLFPKVYKELTSIQLPHNSVSWVKSLAWVGTGAKQSAGELTDWENQRRADAVSAAPISLAIVIINDFVFSERPLRGSDAFQGLLTQP